MEMRLKNGIQIIVKTLTINYLCLSKGKQGDKTSRQIL